MRPMDDVWNDISSLPSPATTTHFQNFFAPALRPPSPATISFHPPPSPTTMLTLLTTTHSDHQDPNKRLKPNPPPPPPCIFTAPTASPPEYTEKFRRLMKNRESAARSRARKQARADQLEHEVMRLAKENAKLKRLQKEVGPSHVPKESRLNRTKSAPF
ncbi:putative transcription factor bZIP family [Helianthus annuus]|nr:putative transcription factor bZIP family [Helianthus annuus]KAJ0687813.1 putative transcription factor bZIP family [Helianthus annuus]KAJ0733020.1 putative transcription factor bZIP family [Helianthus annuus]